MKILIELEDDLAKWAGHRAIDLGISRKSFIADCVADVRIAEEETSKESIVSIENKNIK